jgi:hypothetical protein
VLVSRTPYPVFEVASVSKRPNEPSPPEGNPVDLTKPYLPPKKPPAPSLKKRRSAGAP